MVTTIFTGRGDADTEASPRRGGQAGGKLPASRVTRHERRWGLSFVSPWLVGLTVFYAGPLLASLALSFTSYELVDQDDEPGRFVGLENWSRLLSDPEVRHGAWITLKFSLVFLPIAVLIPLAVAYLLNSRYLKGRDFFRLMFYLPTMVPFIAAVIIWRYYLNGQTGWLARILSVVGIQSPDFINNPRWLMSALWLMALWGIGNAIIIYIAALNGVDVELYEAATIDGASRWRQFRHITVPMISPIIFYNLVLALVAIGQYFVVPYALTAQSRNPGGPDGAVKFYTLYFYQQTFNFFQGGYGAALAWGMFLLIFGATVLLFWSARYWVHYRYEER
jgi:multiple sugar transport system permease protein